MLGSPAGPGAPSQRGLWTSAPIPSGGGFTTDGFGKYGVYSLFPGGPTFGSALYSHANTFGRFTSGQFQPTSGNIFHGSHKDSLFSSTGYTFGVPTPPPGSPYSPIPVTQLELLAKGINSNIIIQQASDFSLSPKKVQITEKRCDEKCCTIKQKSCPCQDDSSSSIKGKFSNIGSGCSRTNPIEWGTVNVKKEPGHPCQVAEVTTSISPVIKVEIASPTQKNGEKDVGSLNGNIPLGITVARQRIQQPELIGSPSLPPTGLLTTVNAAGQIKEIARLSEFESTQLGMAASVTAGGATGGTILQCPDDRSGALASWPLGGSQSSSLGTPTLWQYPAPVPMESMVPLPVPMPPVGFQLVRDPTSGGFLLLPTTTSLEPIQQTVVWPSYPQPSPLLLPPMPPPPLQLLSSATSDYLSSSATYHQQTQTHSTRLVAVTTDAKRKLPLPSTTLIKIEADASTIDQSKTISTMSSNASSMFSDQSIAPLVTTHVIYQHPPNLILSQNQSIESPCKSQASSPLPCLTPPPELSAQSEEPPLAVDASNQTDTPICSEDDNTLHNLPEIHSEPVATTNELREDVSEETSTAVQTILPLEPEEEPELITQLDHDRTDPKEDANNTTIEEEVPPKEHKIVFTPDLSGLELLSNSIVEFESCRNNMKSETYQGADEECPSVAPQNNDKGVEQMTPISVIPHVKPLVEDTLGGLNLLCALAEQRILEESSETEKLKIKQKVSRKEKKRSRKHSSESRNKKHKSDKYSDEERRCKVELSPIKGVVLKRSASEGNSSDIEGDIKCTCRKEKYKSYHTPQSEKKVKKFIASKSHLNYGETEWPCMNAMELDMRMRLADLQRQYREKQKELNKLSSKKRHHHHHRHHSGCSKKRSRKKFSLSDRSEHSNTPPPLLDPVETAESPDQEMVDDLLKPPTLCAIENIKPSRHSSSKKLKLVQDEENMKTEGNYSTNLPVKRKSSTDSHEKEKKSSSKKRKVGQPKKISELYVPTETIVAKKPKSGSFVEYFIAAKEKLQMRKSFSDSPPRFIDDSTVYVEKRNKNNNNNSESCRNIEGSSIRRTYDQEDAGWDTDTEMHHETLENKEPEAEIETPEDHMKGLDEAIKVKTEILDEEDMPDKEETPHICILTPEHLETENLRVLTAMGGLFYAGQLHAVQPPDVYSITLDGERGNRPHIMSREEILRDAIVEIAPKSTQELEPGTRLCAYWSQQYRCLYPGSVAEPGTPNPEFDSKFVAVEFDDGDSGTIVLDDIRLLPANYPVMEYDPNPLLSLSKRKRRTSSSTTSTATERRQTQMSSIEETQELELIPIEVKVEPQEVESHKERKRLKKKKKEKTKSKQVDNEKKKRKKRKHSQDESKHKKHRKKHRKHKKNHHDKEESGCRSSDEKAESDGSGTTSEEQTTSQGQMALNGSYEEEEITSTVQEENTTGEENRNLEENTKDTSGYIEGKMVEEEEDIPQNPEDEVTMDDILEVVPKTKKIRDRQASCESSRSKMSAFLPARQLWSWSGKPTKRARGKGRGRRQYYRSIQRENELIAVGNAAVFLSTGRPDRPYIGCIKAMWEQCGKMSVKIQWFYHPEETVGSPENFLYPGALFESNHYDENEVQTISHKCEVLPLHRYIEALGNDPERFATIYENNDIYYRAGFYDASAHVVEVDENIPFNT